MGKEVPLYYRPKVYYEEDLPIFIKIFEMALDSEMLDSDTHLTALNWYDIFIEAQQRYIAKKAAFEIRRRRTNPEMKTDSEETTESAVDKIRPPASETD